VESDPNRSRTLSGDLVKGKCRKQANNSFGHTLRHFGIRVAFRHVGVWQGVDSTPRPVQFALPVEANKILSRKADGLDVAGPNDPVFADVLHNLLKRLGHSRCLNTSLLNHI
jgi:hypothetical protein